MKHKLKTVVSMRLTYAISRVRLTGLVWFYITSKPLARQLCLIYLYSL